MTWSRRLGCGLFPAYLMLVAGCVNFDETELHSELQAASVKAVSSLDWVKRARTIPSAGLSVKGIPLNIYADSKVALTCEELAAQAEAAVAPLAAAAPVDGTVRLWIYLNESSYSCISPNFGASFDELTKKYGLVRSK